MNKVVLKTNSRAKEEKPKVVRSTGMIPANYYVKGEGSKELKVVAKEFRKLYQTVGDSALFYLAVDEDKKQLPVLIGEVQKDSLTGAFVHVSFRGVDLKDKIKAEIPVEIVGEFGLKDAVLMTMKNTVEVEALPTDLPEKFIIDASILTVVGQTVTLADLSYDKDKVELVLNDEGMEAVVVMAQEHKEVVEEEAPAPEATDAAATAEPADSAKPAAEAPKAE